jgi:hypothetical protein
METSRSEDSANSFSASTGSSNRKRAYRTSCAHFYWVTREAGSFEWFKGVMNEVAEMDKKVGFHRAKMLSICNIFCSDNELFKTARAS